MASRPWSQPLSLSLSLWHYRRNSRYDTITTVRKYNLISEVHKERNQNQFRSTRLSERARIVDGPNQLVTSLGCASHFDRNLLASIINLRVPPSPSVNLRSCLLASSRRVSSRLLSRASLPPLLPQFAATLPSLLTKRNGGIYKRSCQAWNSICLKIYPARRTTPASNNPRDDSQTRETPRSHSLSLFLFFVDMLDGPRLR